MKSDVRAGASRRMPKNYERIYALVCEQAPGEHSTAHEIYVAAHRRFPAMGVSTIYRGLARLRDLGLVAEIIVPGASSVVYERAAPPHAHFRCSSCGAVEDVAYRLPARVLRQLSASQANQIEDVSLVFHGTCRACLTRGAGAATAPPS